MTENRQPPQKSNFNIRVGALLVVFVVTMFVAPKMLTAFAGPSNKWSGSLAMLVFIPGVAVVLWVFFTLITAAIFRAGSSFASAVSCIGVGFALAIIGTIVTFWIYDIPPYGPGP